MTPYPLYLPVASSAKAVSYALKCKVGHWPEDVLRAKVPWYMITLTTPTYGGVDIPANLKHSDTNHNVRVSTDCEKSSTFGVDYMTSVSIDLDCHRCCANSPAKWAPGSQQTQKSGLFYRGELRTAM